MSLWLKQSTSVDVGIGPFVDNIDGFTAKIALTLTQPDIRLKKNSGNWAQKNAAQTLTHEENGWYELTLDSTDTNTLGILLVSVQKSGALPVWHEFHIVAANIYDSFIGGNDVLDVSAIQWLGSGIITPDSPGIPDINLRYVRNTSVPAPTIAGVPLIDVRYWRGISAGTDGSAFPLVNVYQVLGSGINTLVNGRVDVSVGAMAANVITSGSIATDAIGSDELATSAITKIQAGLATSSALATVQADTDDIQTRLPAALVGGRMDSSVGAMASGVITSLSFASGAIDAAAIGANAIGASELAADAANEIADAILTRDMSAVSGEAARSLLNAIRKLINKWSISGTVLTITKEDDSTTAYTQNITSTPNADAITGLDTV